MKVTYDPKHNVAYIQIQETNEPVNNVKVAEDVIMDVDAYGKPVGFELLNAAAYLFQEKVFHFLNEGTNEQSSVLIPA